MVQGALEEEKGEIELSRAQRKELRRKRRRYKRKRGKRGKKTPISTYYCRLSIAVCQINGPAPF